jgi:site-specific DNA-cytosine methylase
LFNYSSIVPLIGGETIAMQKVFGKRPEYLLSYEGFSNNDKHLIEYYNKEVPYHLLDNSNPKVGKVDVVNAVCPCAGLSSLSMSSASDSSTNDWMKRSAEYILENVQPTVMWGENAPRLASKMGESTVNRLRNIGKQNGYTFSIFKTKSILHGLSQVRDRSFYFFWKGDKVPVFNFIQREHEKIEDLIRSVKRRDDDPMNVLANSNIPSEDPYYKYVLQELEGGISHSEFQDTRIERSINPLHYIEDIKGVRYDQVGKWMKANGYEKQAARCQVMYDKLESGMNIMRRGPEIPKDYIGAFVGHYPTSLTHPDEDRYLTIRECLSIMKLPEDFNLHGGKQNINHICQNVPVTTAEDMAKNVKLFLEDNIETIQTDFLVQDNKTQKLEYAQSTLEEFL